MDGRLTEISRREVLRYLQWRGGEVPEELARQLDGCQAALLAAARPRVVWRRYDLLPDMTLASTAFRLQGQAIGRLLADCREVILLCATLGLEAEALLRRAQAGNMAEAVVLDAMGSAAIENVCDNLCGDLAKQFAPRYLTDRFSPGYGDMPIAQQQALFDTLDVTRQIGVTLTESGLMVPQKSVTAVVGIAHRPQPRRRGCGSCENHEQCAYRKEGKHCEA